MIVARRPRHPRRRLPLWCHLTALVLVPLTGVAALTAGTVVTEVRQAGSAETAAGAVAAFGRLTTLGAAVQQEVVPTLAMAVVTTPALAVGLQVDAVQEQQVQALLAPVLDSARDALDDALAAVRADPATRAEADQAALVLATLHRRAAGGALGLADLTTVYDEYAALAQRITVAAHRQSLVATRAEVSGDAAAAIADVPLAGQLMQAAGAEVPEFIGSVLPVIAGAGATPSDGLAAHAAYQQAAQQVEQASWAGLRTRLAAVRSGAEDRAIEALTGALPSSAGAVPAIPQILALLTAADRRNQQVSDLLDAAVSRAREVADEDGRAAERSRDRSLVVALAVLLVSAAAAAGFGHRVSRSLRRLARQAARISEGSLVDVATSGPREVGTVSDALGAAVASLRRIQDQASAVARGDLTDATLQQPLPGPLGAVVHASVEQIVRSVQQSEQLQLELAHQAAHDALTGLPNRAQALQLAAAALHRGQRTGRAVGLLFIDLDGFKAVNDRTGHAAGDAVLQEVARRLAAGLRSGDSVARLGGDEFVAVIEPVDSDEELLHLASRLLASVTEPVTVPGPTGDATTVTVGASIGAAVSTDGSVDSPTLFAQADAAAYQAKTRGRGRVEFYDQQLQARLTARNELEQAVAAGLAAGEFFLVYQPVVDVRSGRPTGFEALVRWQRPGHGLVLPDDFIGVAEQSGLIRDLDRWVLGEATGQLARWRAGAATAAGAAGLTVAVNISGRHLADPRVVADVTGALEAAGLPASALVLEVTETVVVSTPTSLAQLDLLKALGVGVAIDDFGTGYTSIGQLRSIPVDTLKIDRSFVATDDESSHSLVTLMIEAAHTFGLDVVAEGVETTGHLDLLRSQHCDRVQGYLLARPLDAEDAADLLREPSLSR